MANPNVRPHLEFLPVDGGGYMSDAIHGKRWLTEMDPELLTPMARHNGQDYFIFEPAAVSNQSVCMPFRWFKRADDIFARAWTMREVHDGAKPGWVILEHIVLEVALSDLVSSFPFLVHTSYHRGLPDPRNITGIIIEENGHLKKTQWTLTNPEKGNRWRAIAKGHEVLAFPIWLYCDDTSGNSSKKWNKHNSFLFTPAGLAHNRMHYEYNVHFLSTSNLAPPLEMLDGIVEQLHEGQMNGVWAWDCLKSNVVLLIPSVLALLGDNPMQSELSCHVGLNGNLFCRVCLVKGPSKAKDPVATSTSRTNDTNCSTAARANSTGYDSDGSSVSNSSIISNDGPGTPKKKETMSDLVNRAREFLKVSTARTKVDTKETLEKLFSYMCTIGKQVKGKQLKTEKGVKDTYQEHFIELVHSFLRPLRGRDSEKQAQVDEFVKSLPSNVLSPVWRIKELDAHSDTPVEILHVILLGFLKYFWRDAVQRMSPDQKQLLIIRISSFDTAGLNLSPLPGKTFVQYAGSLTGRDFRAISQIAPFILYDLLPQQCFDAWLALCKLIPLIWQPVIRNIEEHLKTIQMHIDYFLDCVANWTPRWFNKPKFHIILHLIEHIRRFGPPLLFATETFESYNALIRSLSVHSNRQAPSRDIAVGFANANRIRHLSSGGKFLVSPKTSNKGTKNTVITAAQNTGENLATVKTKMDVATIPSNRDYRTVGEEVVNLINKQDRVIQLAFGGPQDRTEGEHFRKAKGGSVSWENTLSYKCLCQADDIQNNDLRQFKFSAIQSFSLRNGDKIGIGSFVFADISNRAGLSVGKVIDALQIYGSESELRREPDVILLSLYRTGEAMLPYYMPELSESSETVMIEFLDVVCTVNVQHNCHKHSCGIKNTKAVRQEQEDTGTLAPIVQHEHPKDLVRNAYHFEHFRIEVPQLNREWAIHQGAAREIRIQAEKIAKKTRGGGKAQQAPATSGTADTSLSGASDVTTSTTQRKSSNNSSRKAPGGLLRNVLHARTQSRVPPSAQVTAQVAQTNMHLVHMQGAQGSLPQHTVDNVRAPAPAAYYGPLANPHALASPAYMQMNGGLRSHVPSRLSGFPSSFSNAF